MEGRTTMIRSLRTLAFVATFFMTAQGGFAQSPVDAERLDMLFDRLAQASSQMEASEIAAAIWQAWTEPDDPELSELMAIAGERMAMGAFEPALAMLDDIVARWPDYAEGWNRRATLYFIIGDDEASLADIAETLAREPRHFGALSGRAMIEMRQGRTDAARQTMIEALEIYPFMEGRALFPDLPAPLTRT
jgi:tetratricopeptide (TPR) repeat protein